MTSTRANPRVLFVDDEPRVVALVTRTLIAQGLSVTGHSDPMAAWEAFRNAPEGFDIVVVDYQMPRMPGIELARRVSHYVPSVPILLLSGCAESIPSQDLLEAGITECLPKPFPLRRLAERILAVINRQHRGPSRRRTGATHLA